VRIIQRLIVTGLVVLSVSSPAAAAQEPPAQAGRQAGQRGRGQGGPPAAAAGMPLQQMQTMFDAYVLVQAKRALQLDDEQYPRFFTRMTELQELRRQHTQQRTRMLTELRRLFRGQQADEARLNAQLKALDELETKFEAGLRAARQAIDETLTTRQRANFRFFEEDMDRQKLDFLTRSRQGGRGGPGGVSK